MRRWYREVYPSSVSLISAAVIYAVMIFLPQWAYRAAGGIGWYLEAWKVGAIPLGLFTVLYSLYRVVWFHPVCQPEYLAWLRQTPWRHGKPLPGGPLHLVSQDVILVGLLTALACWHLPEFVFLIPALFVGTRIVTWGFNFLFVRFWKHVYLMILVSSGLLVCWNSPIGLLVVIAALYAIVAHGIRESLRNFDEWSGRNTLVSSLFIQSKGKNEKLLGWPYDRMGPRLANDGLTFGWSVAISMLVAWWAFLPVAIFFPYDSGALIVPCIIAAACAIGRLAVYLSGCSDPLSFRARILTGRLSIPGFDIVYLAPALMLLLTTCIGVGSFLWGLSYSISAAIISGGSLFLFFECPPGLNEWRLTGKHRIVPGFVFSASEMLQTQ